MAKMDFLISFRLLGKMALAACFAGLRFMTVRPFNKNGTIGLRKRHHFSHVSITVREYDEIG